jgi:hypothetical protein
LILTRNQFFGIDVWGPFKFENSGSGYYFSMCAPHGFSCLAAYFREEVFMEGPIEPNMGPSLADVLLCTLESPNAGFSSFPVRKLLS